MTENYFDIKRDNELIAAGTHFWCQACVISKSASEQSPDQRYCQSCFDVLKVEAAFQPSRGVAWMPKNISHKTAPDATQTTPEGQEVVAKITGGGKLPVANYATGKQRIMQHARGRPRKKGEVHRATRWRRAKQEVLV